MEIISEEIKAAKEAGFSDTEIRDNFADEINAAKAAGFTEKEINKEYGLLNPEPSLFTGLLNIAKENFRLKREGREQLQKEVKQQVIGEEFDGDYILQQILGGNLYNLSYRASKQKGTPEALKMPRPEDLTWTEDFLITLGTLGTELPIYAGSALPGFFAGGPIGAGFTGAAIPTTTRETLLKVLENQDYNKPSDVMKIILEETLWEGTKEGIKFASAMALPLARIPGVGQLSKNYFSRTASQILGYEGAGLAIDRELPTWYDFSQSAALFGIFNLAVPRSRSTQKTKDIFIETGTHPTDVVLKSESNRTVREDIVSKNIKVPREYEKTRQEQKTIEARPDEVQVIKIEDIKDPIDKKATENISFETTKVPITKEQVSNTLKNTKRKFVINIIDQKYPVLEALRDANIKTKTGIEKLNIYEALRILEGMQGRSAHFVEYGTLDFATLKDKGPSLISIVEPFAKDKKVLKLFSAYLTNKHAIDLSTRGIETGIDIPNARKFIEKYKSKFDETSKKYNQYQKEVLEYARDGGFITQDQFNAWTNINKNYVSMARELPREGESGFIKGSVNPFKKLKGSKLKIIDPLESTLKNTDFIIRATEKNKVGVDFIEFVEKMKKEDPKIFDYIKKKKAPMKPIKVMRKELEQFFEKQDIQNMSDSAVESFTIFRQEYIYPDKNSIGIRRNGKYEVWEVGEEIATAFRSTDIQAMNFWQRWLSAPARTLRTGAIVTPDFALPNFFRDTLNATFLSKVGWTPIADSMVGAFHVIYKDPKRATDAYKRYLKSGGSQSTLRAIDQNLFDKGVHEVLNKGVMRNEYKGVLGPLRYLTDISELMTRVQMSEKVYKVGKKKGLTERQALERAGFEARDLLDYQKKGTAGAVVNRYSAFWNARVQGTTKVYEAFRDRPQKAFAMVGLTVALPTLGFLALNYDFEKKEFNQDYKELPEYIKQNKWYFNIDGQGYFFPKGFEIGTFFAGIIEKTALWIAENDPEAWTEFLKDFTISNVKSYNPAPTWFRPLFENFADYSFFRDGPILPADAPKNMLNQYYSTEYTNESIKKIAEGLAKIVGPDNYFANPIYLENIYDQWTGGIGRIVKESIDKIAITGGLIDDPIKPTDPLTKIPGIRVFQAKDVYGNAASVSKFYKKIDKYQKTFNTLTFLKDNNRLDEYQELRKDFINQYKLDPESMLDIRKQMGEIAKSIRIVYNAKYKDDGSLFSGDEKLELIEDLYKARIGIAQKGLQILKDIEQKTK